MSTTWRAKALCRGDEDLFIPDDTTPTAEVRRLYREAKSVCTRCPVRTPCLDAAMREERLDAQFWRAGVRGGLTPLARARLARSNKQEQERREREGAGRAQ